MFEENLQEEKVYNGPGFYKRDGENLLYAPHFVKNKDFELRIEEKDSYTYPVDGWSYFESEEVAEQNI